ncbi:MAG: hypothetical protein VB046_01655 [Paludibacter sp.]|nr:hypothetical protein [Paludibacter sp.]
MKKSLLLIFLLISFFAVSQDLITFRNGTQLECKIIKTDDNNVHYRFIKNNREIETFSAKYEISRLQYDYKTAIENKHAVEDKVVVIDTTLYTKETTQWINLLTYSPAFGINARGWSLHYRGFQSHTNNKWSIPITFVMDFQTLDDELLYQSGYAGISMLYYQAGISPIRKLNDYFFLNLGANLIYGFEKLITSNYHQTESTLFGIATQQGLLIIPKSRFGICLGISVYQKLMTSKVYRNDLGIKFDVGIKF